MTSIKFTITCLTKPIKKIKKNKQLLQKNYLGYNALAISDWDNLGIQQSIIVRNIVCSPETLPFLETGADALNSNYLAILNKAFK